jgi:toxin HigB-1
VEITFAKTQVQKTCESRSKLQRKHGEACAKKLMTRLTELAAAATLEEMRAMSGNCHELDGDRDRQLAIELSDGKRLLIEPDEDPVPEKEDGGLDWSAVVAIRIIGIVDYH